MFVYKYELMPPRKKRSIGKTSSGEAPTIAHADLLAEGVEVIVSERDHAASESTLSKEPNRRKHDASVEFWRSLGYYDSHPNHNKSRCRERPAKAPKKQHDHGRIKEMYRLCTNQAQAKRSLLIQYPNREPHQQYREETRQKPSEIRIKPKCGVVEVDIPIHTGEFFDQEKGVDFGSALRRARLLQTGKSYGLAGGLGIGPNKGAKSTEDMVAEGPSKERLLENFDDSNNKGYVMTKITLGGRVVPFQEGDPIYMISTFQGSKCIEFYQLHVFIPNQQHVHGQSSMLWFSFGHNSAI